MLPNSWTTIIRADNRQQEEVGRTLIGLSRTFLAKEIITSDKFSQFKRQRRLIDGSVLTVYKTTNKQYFAIIDPVIDLEDLGEFEFEFYLSLDSYTGTSHNILTSTATSNTMLVGISSKNNLIGKLDDSFIAGNIDFTTRYTWHGPLSKDLPVYPDISSSGVAAFRSPYTIKSFSQTIVSQPTFPFTTAFYYIYYRYSKQVFFDGEVVLDTSDNVSESNGLVLGYCRKDDWEMVITWNLSTGFDKEDTVWLKRNDIWTDLGKITYVGPADNTRFTVGRGQCITFNEDCTSFTGVVNSHTNLADPQTSGPQTRSQRSHLVKGTVVFGMTGVPIGVSVIIDTVDYLSQRDQVESQVESTIGNVLYISSFSKALDSSLLEKVPISSAYSSDGTLNILYLEQDIEDNSSSGTASPTDFDGGQALITAGSAQNSSSSLSTIKYTSTTGLSITETSTSSSNNTYSLGIDSVSGLGPGSKTETSSSLGNSTKITFIDLRDDFYVRERASSTGTSSSSSSFEIIIGSSSYSRSGTSSTSITGEALVKNPNRPVEDSILIKTPSSSITPISDSGSGDDGIYLEILNEGFSENTDPINFTGLVPTLLFNTGTVGTLTFNVLVYVPRTMHAISNRGNRLVSYSGFSDVENTLNVTVTKLITTDNIILDINWKTLYNLLEIGVPSLPRFWEVNKFLNSVPSHIAINTI